MKILLPVDGSAFTKRMISYISAHDELLGAKHEYTLCTVVPRISGRAASFLDSATMDKYYADEASEVLGPLEDFVAQKGWKVKSIHLVGRAADAIAELAAAEDYDLIVMGTHGHSLFGNVVMGSVATGVIARCKQPVLLVPKD